MKRLSLTAHLSLLFMMACIAILMAAAVYMQLISRAHFLEADRHTLQDEMGTLWHLLARTADRQHLPHMLYLVEGMLEAHHHLHVEIQDATGIPVFRFSAADDAALQLPQELQGKPDGTNWEFVRDGVSYRGLTRHVQLQDGTDLRLQMVLDTEHHGEFHSELRRWFAMALVVFGLFGALLGWLMARRGLRPLLELAELARGISARALRQPIELEVQPDELAPLVDALNAMLIRLDDSFARLNNFSADIAHELRTPLTNLMTRTEVILSRPRDLEGYREALIGNLEALRNMSRMIDDMLFLARADNGRLVPVMQRIWLAPMLDDLVEYYQLLADDAGISIEYEGNGRLDGDASMLRRALSNLLSNALRYTPAGGCIHIQVRHKAQELQLEISNPGPAILPEHLQHLFERFYRADPARSEGHSNVGLGLAITRSIVEAHGGQIDCSSDEGLTTFILRFRSIPFCEADEA